MNQEQYILEFNQIKEMLVERAITKAAKERLSNLSPILKESLLRQAVRETSEAKRIIEVCGSPHLAASEEISGMLMIAEKQGMLFPEQLEKIMAFTASSRRLKAYLKKGEAANVSLAFSGQEIDGLREVFEEINRCIRGNEITSDASKTLAVIRTKKDKVQLEIQTKLANLLKTKKNWFTESFISMKNGHYTLPVKKEFKNQLSGSVIMASGTGETYFIEPVSVIRLTQELEELSNEEAIEEGRILYALTALVYQYKDSIAKNIEVMEALDFIFAKAKLSVEMDAVEPEILTDRRIEIKKGRHPLLAKERCVPIDFFIGGDIRGIVITGPNTGGKTVTLKLIGLFSLMAQSGLHLPCEAAKICMNSCVLCDIGDGQSINQNLSTFSAHLTNIISILKKVQKDSLVLLDEVGSGTDPEEGMGLAVAILEQLRQSECLFAATTHYVEVKTYAEVTEYLSNARMTFDKNTLKPLYQLIIGEAGESCAFDIARRLGFPENLLSFANRVMEGGDFNSLTFEKIPAQKEKDFSAPKIIKTEKRKELCDHAAGFAMGDSVMVFPEKAIGIVFQPSDDAGNLIVQIKDKKRKINHKRLKLIAPASQLYPEDYDFSIIFNTVKERKTSHQMDRKYSPGLELYHESDIVE